MIKIQKSKILYIDDEDLLLDITKTFLENKYNFSVETTTSPNNALKILEKENFDLVLSDYEMPEMNGIEVLKEIKRRIPQMPVIIFTGKGRENIVIEALNEGASFYIQKGGDNKSLFAELANLINCAIEKKKTADKILFNEKRLQALVNFYKMSNSDLNSLMDFALLKIIRLTKSNFGYFAFTDETNDSLKLYSYTKNSLNQSDIQKVSREYKISDEKIISSIIEQKKPVIENNQTTENNEMNNLPGSEVSKNLLELNLFNRSFQLNNHLGVPVFEEGRTVMVAGVANKDFDYDNSDICTILILMNGLWLIIRQKGNEKRLQEILNV